MWHSHKFGKVQEDGYQYCEKCGRAILPPCNHNWEIIRSLNRYDWRTQKPIHLIEELRCTLCGDIKVIEVT